MRSCSCDAQATEADVSGAHHDLRIIMQQHAELSSGGKRTGALLLPAQHAAPRHLDRKVEDPDEQEVVDSAASTREEHQRANHEQDCGGVEQEHGDHTSTMNNTAAPRKSGTKSSNAGKRAWHADASGAATTTRRNINTRKKSYTGAPATVRVHASATLAIAIRRAGKQQGLTRNDLRRNGSLLSQNGLSQMA